MAWDHGGRYYTRSHKVNGRVVREYIGGGEKGEIAAQIDAYTQKQRKLAQERWHDEKADLVAFDRQIEAFYDLGEVIAAAAMTMAGFHQHRGHWRRRRERREDP